jgi:peptidylprolyl isomerase
MLKKLSILALAVCAIAVAAGYTFADTKPAQTQAEAAQQPVPQPAIIPQETTTQPTSEESEIKKLSEAFGHFIGRNLKSPVITFDLEEMIKGIREGAEGKPAPMTEQEYETLMTKIQEKVFNKLSEENLQAANEYLAKNAAAAGVIEIEPGKLQYIVLEQGNGETVKEHDAPQIRYTGKFIDGSVFGNSDETGGTITVPLDQTIPGFSKGIAGMKEGEKRRLFVHPSVGYGTQGQLPPNSLLIFDVEVVKANAPTQDKLSAVDDYSDDEDLDDEDDSDDVPQPKR